MTTEADENSSNTSAPGEAESTPDFSSCGPGCGCKNSSGKTNTKAKIAICLIVVVAVVGILIFKTTNATQKKSIAETTSFPTAMSSTGTVLNSSAQKGGSGAPISAIADLNAVAGKLDTVFLVVPDKNNSAPAKETSAALATVERTLNKKGVSTGIYTLRPTSPEYADVAAKVTPPGIAVLTKGGGIGFASGGISESNLTQAYIASTRGGGCCPTGGSAPGKPCK